MGRKRGWYAVLLLLAAPLAQAQAGDGHPADGENKPVAAVALVRSAPEEVVREIDDPHTGLHWLLMRNQIHPAGPGRLVESGGAANASGRAPSSPDSEAEPEKPLPVIHAGDPVTVEEKTAVVDAHLEAVALGPAAVGAPFDVRLKVGGKVLRAVALGSGRAALQKETGGRP